MKWRSRKTDVGRILRESLMDSLSYFRKTRVGAGGGDSGAYHRSVRDASALERIF